MIGLAGDTVLAAELVGDRFAGGGLARDRRLPFGPFLAAGAWIVWLYGPLSLAWPAGWLSP